MLVFIFCATTTKDESLNTVAIPWAQYSQGVASAIILEVVKDNSRREKVLTIYIKNTSQSIKEFVGNGRDWGIHIYYVSANGVKTPIHDYDATDLPRKMALPTPILPSQMIERKIELNADELSRLQTLPVQCDFEIYDPSSIQGYKIESTPKMLPIKR